MKLASLAFALLIELIYIYIYIYLIWTTTHAFPFRERLVPPLANNRPTLLSSPLSSLPRDRDWNVKFWGDTRTTSSTPKKERFNIRGYVTRLATLESFGLLFGTRNGQNCFHDFHVITPPWFTKNGKRRMVWKFRAAVTVARNLHSAYPRPLAEIEVSQSSPANPGELHLRKPVITFLLLLLLLLRSMPRLAKSLCE